VWIKVLILLLQLGELIEIQLVGTISASGIFYILWFAYNFVSGRWSAELRPRLIYKISKLYLWLFVFQLVSEIIVGNEVSNAMKGLAVTVLSYMKFMCLWPIVKNDGRRITWLFACMVISGAISFKYMSDSEFVMDSLINGSEYSIFKFKIAPLLGDILVVLSFFKFEKRNIALLSMITGAICAVLGARSTGLMIFLTGFIVFVINHMNRVITRKQIITWSLFGSLVLYCFFALYVTAVLNGTIVGGNSKDQFARVEHPYNPIHILLSGRTESPASMAAISDRPFTGFGAWAEDPGFKYHSIQANAQGEALIIRDDTSHLIPAHSVVLQTGVHEGIFAMTIMIFILYFFIRRGAKSINKNNVYNYLVVYCIMQLSWHGLFSPVSHFRNSFPIYFCCCLFSYRYSIYKKKLNNR
jgi:hypothetical protein